ncbi:hypothetical protein [Acrocarpospora sp. B8E8]|uniref:hypothetical protein n=1 Tax=Acrocarpospora sp. B8E8 TaxID=3153572 RepID=UPI00325F19FC
MTPAVAHPDAAEHLRGSLRAGAEVYASERHALRAIYSMAALHPAVPSPRLRWPTT